MKMTVGELITALEIFDQDMQIAMSQDSEGNGFSPYIEAEAESNVVILWPGGMGEIDELEDFKDDESEVE